MAAPLGATNSRADLVGCIAPAEGAAPDWGGSIAVCATCTACALCALCAICTFGVGTGAGGVAGGGGVAGAGGATLEATLARTAVGTHMDRLMWVQLPFCSPVPTPTPACSSAIVAAFLLGVARTRSARLPLTEAAKLSLPPPSRAPSTQPSMVIWVSLPLVAPTTIGAPALTAPTLGPFGVPRAIEAVPRVLWAAAVDATARAHRVMARQGRRMCIAGWGA